MSKEEIALQLTLAKLDFLQLSRGCASSPCSQNSDFNIALGKEIANIYNSIYNNLDCYKPSDSNLDSISIDNDLEII